MRDVDVPARRGIRFPGSIVGMPPMRDADGSIDAEAGLGGIEGVSGTGQQKGDHETGIRE